MALVTSLVAIALPARAQEVVEVYTDDWSPYVNPQGERIGAVQRIIDVLLRETGREADFVYTDFTHSRVTIERCSQNQTADCRVSLSAPFYKSAERLESVEFSEPLFTATSVLFFNRRNGDAVRELMFAEAFPSAETAPSEDGQTVGECPAMDNFEAFDGQRIGLVKGFLYGRRINCLVQAVTGQIDTADEPVNAVGTCQTDGDEQTAEQSPLVACYYPSEADAMRALVRNEVDYFPMTRGAGFELLERDFPDRRELIGIVEGTASTETLHAIAPRTPQGRALIADLNEAMATLADILVMEESTRSEDFAQREDIAEITAAEGYPIIIGTSCYVDPDSSECVPCTIAEKPFCKTRDELDDIIRRQNDDDGLTYFAIPEGTRIVVLDWSEKILNKQDTDRLYDTMTDQSRVVVLNGPHAGSELWVRNMHIKIVK